MHEAMFYSKIKNKSVQCGLCARKCMIMNGNTGFCRVRKNDNGKLYSLVYGKIVSMAVDPIEKKPFFHFMPGMKAFSISTVGCNFKCPYCYNWHISQEWNSLGEENSTPKQIINAALKSNCQGIAYTYVEPTMFYEFSYDTAKISKNLCNMWITNGYTSREPINKISKYIDAVVVDFKCSANQNAYKRLCQADVEHVFEAAKLWKKNKVHVEITNLLIPGQYSNSDTEEFCRWIKKNLGENTPLHLLQFFPTYKMTSIPRTPEIMLEQAYKIAKSSGLNYVYVGNIAGNKYENTYCHKCNEILIKRFGMQLERINLKNGKCPKCSAKIPLVLKKP